MVNRKKGSKQIKSQTVNIYLDDSLSGIKRTGEDPEDRRKPLKIHSHLHLIVLSGKYNYKSLEEKLGRLKVDNNFLPKNRQPHYRTKVIKNYKEDISLHIFINPLQPIFPHCYMEIHQKNNPGIRRLKKFLMSLAKDFPELNISKVEYANDIYCFNPEAVKNLFEILRRHLNIPYQRKIIDYGEKIGVKYGKMNRVYRVGDEKIYERGGDKDKCGEGWPIEYLDRVRLEHTAKRQQLIRRGIRKIGDLAKNPKFYELNKGVYRFVNFERLKKLPKIYDAYNSDPSNKNSFQAECIFHRKKVKNIVQYISDTPHFEELVSTLANCYARFDKNWDGYIIC